MALTSYMMFLLNCQDAKRAHHNALERKRRDHIKESFLSLRNAVPHLQNGRTGKSTSVRASASVMQSSGAAFG